MHSKINELVENFEEKRQKFLTDLYQEYEKLKVKYDFHLEKGRVYFSKKARKLNKLEKKPLWRTLIWVRFPYLISAPFIYGMIIPAVFLDICLFIYQQTCFRLYGIPFVKRSEYIVFDRKYLDYLNIYQKFNCLYCSYFNGLMSYAVEVAGRTEKYWCPIKSAEKNKASHNWQKYFADYGDAVGFKEVYVSTKEFKNLKE